MIVRVVKQFNMYLSPLKEGEAICDKNPDIPHAAMPEHSCLLEIEEVEMSQEEYNRRRENNTVKSLL